MQPNDSSNDSMGLSLSELAWISSHCSQRIRYIPRNCGFSAIHLSEIEKMNNNKGTPSEDIVQIFE